MALQTKSISANGSKGHHKFTLNVTENSTNISGNNSPISWSFVLSSLGGGYDWEYSATVPVSYSITINGTTYTGNIMNYDGNSTVTIKSGSMTVPHNSDGTKSISYSFSVTSLDVYYLTGSASASGSMTLTTIPRASKVNEFSGNIGETVTINISRASSSFTHNLTYQFGTIMGSIKSGVGTSCTWEIPTGFYGMIPNANSGTGTITCTTYNGDTKVGTSTTPFTAKVINSNPIAGSFTYKDSNSFTTNITGDNKRIIRENSNLVFTIGNATALNRATISKYEVTFNGETKSLTSTGNLDFGLVNLSSDATAILKVIDSRGNSSTKEITVTIDDWKLPTGIITLNRKNNYYSETYLKVDGTYSSLNGKNSMAIQYQYKKVTEKNFSALYDLADNTQTTLDLDNNYQWNVIVIVGDRIGETTYNLFVDRGMPIIFFDRVKSSVGINCFPSNENEFELNGTTLPIAGTPSASSFSNVGDGENLQKSGLYSVQIDDVWYSLINTRHRNGKSDGINYGMQIRNKFALGSKLEFRQQNGGGWVDWEIIPRYKTLFKNVSGSSNTITLTESSSNFDYLEIFYKNNDNIHNSVKVNTPNGKKVVLSTLTENNENGRTYFKSAVVLISGTSITFTSTGQGYNGESYLYQDGSYSAPSGSPMISIVEVVGYR